MVPLLSAFVIATASLQKPRLEIHISYLFCIIGGGTPTTKKQTMLGDPHQAGSERKPDAQAREGHARTAALEC